MLGEDRKSQIIAKILGKNPNIECTMCHHRHFALLDGYITENIQNNYKSIIVGGGTILPLATIICENCGFIAQYSLGALGLMEDQSQISSPDTISNSDKEEEK